jgi:glutamine amidotransferase
MLKMGGLSQSGRAFSEAVVVASERLDGDAGWREVPDRHMLLVNSNSGAVLRPL